MDNAVLLTKLSNYDDVSFDLFNYYVNATSKTFADNIEEFNTCIENIKKLTELQYDFSWLSENANEFGCNRRDFKTLCDDVCSLLGNRINELCKHTKTPIVTKPSNFEDYCPYSKEMLVAYGSSITSVRVDGKLCKIIETKLESTPYYNIYISQLDL